MAKSPPHDHLDSFVFVTRTLLDTHSHFDKKLYVHLYYRQPILVLYACFGLSYFYYDVVVMFIGAYLEDKQEDPQRSLYYIWTKFYRKKKLIILHHILLPLVGFPALTVSVLNLSPNFFVFKIRVHVV